VQSPVTFRNKTASEAVLHRITPESSGIEYRAADRKEEDDALKRNRHGFGFEVVVEDLFAHLAALVGLAVASKGVDAWHCLLERQWTELFLQIQMQCVSFRLSREASYKSWNGHIRRAVIFLRHNLMEVH
jgi:hypothetical protein